jgi:peptidyl-prolyl cis-trans isomerase C
MATHWGHLAYVGIVALAALAAPAADARDPSAAGKVAAVVNGEPIPLEDVEAIVRPRPVGQSKLSEAERLELQREALDMLVDDVILRQFLRKNAAPVRPAEVTRKLSELAESLKGQGQTLEAYCRESVQTEAELRASVAAMIQRAAYLARHVSEADVRKYYDDNREFFDRTTVRASHILYRLPPGSPPEQVAAARAKLDAVRQQVLAGKLDFAEAARQHSQCPSAPTGGDIGYFPRKGVVEESFARVAFTLKKDEVSDVVQTSYGLHLIRVTDRRSGPPVEYAQIESKVREMAGEEMLMAAVARERATARIDVKLGAEQEPKKGERRSWLGGR